MSDQQIEKIVNCPHSTYKAFGEHKNIVDADQLDIKYAFTIRDEFEDILRLIETSFKGASRSIEYWYDEGTGSGYINIYYHKGKLYDQTEYDAGFGFDEEDEYELRYESIEKWFEYIIKNNMNE